MGWLGLILKVISGGFSRLLVFFVTKPGVYITFLALAIGAIWFANDHGYRHGAADTEAAHKINDANALALVEHNTRVDQSRRDRITHDAELQYAIDHQKTITVTNTIIRRIRDHVDETVDRSFAVPCGLVRVLDAATLSTDPDTLPYPAGLSDDTKCPIAPHVLAESGVAAIRGYIEVSAQLTALQDWIRAQAGTVSERVEFPLHSDKSDGHGLGHQAADNQPNDYGHQAVSLAQSAADLINHQDANGPQ